MPEGSQSEVSGTGVGGGIGVVDVCDRYGEGILPGEERGGLKVVMSTTG